MVQVDLHATREAQDSVRGETSPISLITIIGLPRRAMSISISRATSRPEDDLSAISARIREGGLPRSSSPQASAVGKLVRGEVERTPLVRGRRDQYGASLG